MEKPSKKLKQINKSEVNMRFTDSPGRLHQFVLFRTTLNVSKSPKLIRWPRAHMLIAYMLYIC